MSITVIDTLKPLGNFPVAKTDNINHGTESLSAVLDEIETNAFSGSYNDLTNKPTIPTKTSQLTNDSGFMTEYTEIDPTVPDWARTPNKPSYTKSEIGLGNVDNTSDINKPISTAQQTALNLKLNKADINYVTPQMYGAKGDGLTDDTASVNAAFNSGAKSIYFPPGTYLINSDISVDSHVKHIYGSDYSTTTIKGGGLDFLPDTNDSIYVSVHDLHLIGKDYDSDDGNYTGDGISGNFRFSNFRNIRLDYYQNAVRVNKTSWVNLFENIQITYCVKGFATWAKPFNLNTFLNCRVNHCSSYAFIFRETKNVTLIGCDVEECGSVFVLGEAKNFKADSCYFEGNTNIVKWDSVPSESEYLFTNCYMHAFDGVQDGWACLIKTGSIGYRSPAHVIFEKCEFMPKGNTVKPFAFTNDGTTTTIYIDLEKNSYCGTVKEYYDLFNITNRGQYLEAGTNGMYSDIPIGISGGCEWYRSTDGNLLMDNAFNTIINMHGYIDINQTGSSTALEINVPRSAQVYPSQQSTAPAYIVYKDGTSEWKNYVIDSKIRITGLTDKLVDRVYLNATYRGREKALGNE